MDNVEFHSNMLAAYLHLNSQLMSNSLDTKQSKFIYVSLCLLCLSLSLTLGDDCLMEYKLGNCRAQPAAAQLCKLNTNKTQKQRQLLQLFCFI